jgi:DNA replication initiation complex subunit (GINS family)
MITYNDIYEASRKERYSEQLQPLSEEFLKDVEEYLKDKKALASKEDGSFADVIAKTKKQIENAITLFRELMIRRRKKILDLVLIATETGISKQDFQNMLDFEKNLFEKLMENIENSDKTLLNIIDDKNGENEHIVRFLSDIDEFMGFDGNKVGPFKKDETANLPKAIANILIEDGKAEKI